MSNDSTTSLAPETRIVSRRQWRSPNFCGTHLILEADDEQRAEAAAASYGLVADLAEISPGRFEVLVLSDESSSKASQ